MKPSFLLLILIQSFTSNYPAAKLKMSRRNVAYRSPQSSSSVPNSKARTFKALSYSIKRNSLSFYSRIGIGFNLGSFSDRIMIAFTNREFWCQWFVGREYSSCLIAGYCKEFIHDNPRTTTGTYYHLKTNLKN